MTVFWPYFLVFVLSAVPMVEAIVMIPVGIFAGLSTSLVTVLAFMGNVLTLLLAILFIDRLKGGWARRKGGPLHPSASSGQNICGTSTDYPASPFWVRFWLALI
ncbi:hypothetical protein [Brevibacillus massiliensis]|uniref:hypothetical protein n=1 Tax=Brevibacillus massiliensis TaxID=1118054 RepID=UPI00030EBD32|nr:hypothetical protein [Brevibacillus massiliensis]